MQEEYSEYPEEQPSAEMADTDYDRMPSEVETTEYAPPKRSEETIRWQLSVEDLIETMQMLLAGMVYSERENKWKPLGIRLMNDKGIRTMVTVLSFHVNKNIMLSNFNNKEIRSMMERIHRAIASRISLSFDKNGKSDFDIEKANLDLITHSVTNFIWGGLKRAELGAEKKFLSETQRITEKIVTKPEKKKGGFLASLGLGGD